MRPRLHQYLLKKIFQNIIYFNSCYLKYKESVSNFYHSQRTIYFTKLSATKQLGMAKCVGVLPGPYSGRHFWTLVLTIINHLLGALLKQYIKGGKLIADAFITPYVVYFPGIKVVRREGVAKCSTKHFKASVYRSQHTPHHSKEKDLLLIPH